LERIIDQYYVFSVTQNIFVPTSQTRHAAVTAYGRIVTAVEKQQQHALPIGLIGPHVRLKRPVKQGTILTYDDVEFTEQPFIVTLRELLDRGAARDVG